MVQVPYDLLFLLHGLLLLLVLLLFLQLVLWQMQAKDSSRRQRMG
jgi:hypothetical protein